MVKKFFNVKTIIFTILTVVLLLLMPKLCSLFMILFASFVFAAALNPFVNKVQEKLNNRALSASIIVLTAIVALFALILPILIMCYKEIELFVSILPQKATNLYNFFTSTKLYGHTIANLIPTNNLANASSDIAQNVFNQSLNITMGFAQAVFITLALTMFTYYILVDKEDIEKYKSASGKNILEFRMIEEDSETHAWASGVSGDRALYEDTCTIEF